MNVALPKINGLPGSTVVLKPSKIQAIHNPIVPNRIIISVEGIAEDVCNIHLREIGIFDLLPVFEVVGTWCFEPIARPYNVWGQFFCPEDVDYILVKTPDGTEKVPIKGIDPEELEIPPAVKLAATNPNQVIGAAPFSSDFQIAFNDAIEQLYKQFPGHVNAIVTEIGFSAGGSPVGFAATYVIMEQQS